jgi:hypothetical protein
MPWVEQSRDSIAFLPFGDLTADFDDLSSAIRPAYHWKLELVREAALLDQ